MKNFLFVFLLLLSGLSVAAQDKIIEVTLTSGSILAIQANEWRMVTEKSYGTDIDYGYGTTAVVHRATNTYSALASAMCSSGIVTQIYIQGVLTNVVINVRYVAKIVQKPNGKGSIVMLQSNKVWDTNITYADVVDLFDNCITSGGGGGGGATNLSFTRTATTLTVVSDTGNDAVLPAATTSLSGVLSATDKTKLDGLSNYTAPNHTGDVTSVGDGATTIVANVVDNTKLADMPATTLKGNNTGSSGNPVDLTVAQTKTLLAYTGADVSNTPAGTLSATNTQAAINELDSEKHVALHVNDEGASLGTAGTANSIDFTGAGVTATRSGNVVTVAIPGGAGGGVGAEYCTDTITITGITPTPVLGSGMVRVSGGWDNISGFVTTKNPDGVVVYVNGSTAVIATCGSYATSLAAGNYYADSVSTNGFTTTTPTGNIRPLGHVTQSVFTVSSLGTVFQSASGSGISSVSVTARLTGNGTSGSPLDIAQQSATSGQVLSWNGTAWAPATVSLSNITRNIGTVPVGITTAYNTYGFCPTYSNSSSVFASANTTLATTLHQFYITNISGSTVTIKGSGEALLTSTFAYTAGETYYLRDDGSLAITGDSDGDAIDYLSPCLYVIASLGSNNYIVNFYSPIHTAVN